MLYIQYNLFNFIVQLIILFHNHMSMFFVILFILSFTFDVVFAGEEFENENIYISMFRKSSKILRTLISSFSNFLIKIVVGNKKQQSIHLHYLVTMLKSSSVLKIEKGQTCVAKNNRFSWILAFVVENRFLTNLVVIVSNSERVWN